MEFKPRHRLIFYTRKGKLLLVGSVPMNRNLKMGSLFFQRSKNSSVPKLLSVFCRGAGDEVLRSLPVVEAKVAS